MAGGRWDVVVVGAGIGGLTAARDLTLAGRDVLVLEGSPTPGGKLRRAEVAGVTVDVGAEAMLARRPEGVALAQDLGIDVVHPTAAAAQVWSRGALRRLPRSLMGVPLDLDDLASSGVLSAEGLERARHEFAGTAPAADVSVGDLVAERLGDEVVDRLVEPLLAGVYAGWARRISAAAAVPQLLAMARRGSLLEQASATTPADGPVFAGLVGGTARLAEVLAGQLPVRTSASVRAVQRVPGGWRLTVGSAAAPEAVLARAVVLATPAAATARLLADVAPGAARELVTVQSASVAVVTLAFRPAAVGHLDGRSGFLVPPVEGRGIKASTFSFAKWDWVREAGDGLALLRTSLGRHGESAALRAPDAALVDTSVAELARMAAITTEPVGAHVQRWGGALPQYAVGHVELVARVRAALPTGIAVCGAAYDGVGIPAVIGSAHRAAADLGRAE